MLTGVGTWVGKPAYLATDPLTLQEGWQEIAWAMTKCQIKARGPRHPCVNPSTPIHSDLTDREIHPKETFLEMTIQTTNYHHTDLQGAITVIDVEETRDFNHLKPHHHPQNGFESNRSLVSTASLMSLLSDWSEGPQCL